MRTAIALLLLPLLAACQSPNPYQAESLPLPFGRRIAQLVH